MDNNRAVRISKYLSRVLRHHPEAAGISLDSGGWASVDELLAGATHHGFKFNRAELDYVVETNDKRRFTLSPDGQRIRANQGHSVAVDLGLEPMPPPARLFHGTVERYLARIMAEGLQKRSRQYVHLSADEKTAIQVGARRGAAVVVQVDAGAMHLAGYKLFLSANGVWLTDAVPPEYLSIYER